MADETTLWQEVGQALAVGASLTAAAWGALGGATAAVAIEVDRKAVVRQIVLGAMVSAGVGALAMALAVKLMGLQPELIPVGAGLGNAHYLIGVFGPALIERLLRRLHATQGAEGDKGGA